ncbi:MAG: hypothetical protein AAGD28_21180 [Bacteroidota bacterium]
MNERHFLNLCKSEVEEKLNWPPSKDWRQRDYVNLLSLIEQESGISLSLSTIKRIWKADYSGTPQPATLDALAQFIGYQNWLEFKSRNQEKPGRTTSPEKRPINLRLSLALLISLIILIGIYFLFSPGKKVQPIPTPSAKLTVKNSSPLGVPNTVIFSYKLDEIEADSFFIQQSWNRFRRESIRKEDSILTTTYYYPGAHKASLLADEEILAQTTLHIQTEDWIALSRKGLADPAPLYLPIDSSHSEGLLRVSSKELSRVQQEQNPERLLSYYYVNEFEGLDQQQYRLKLRLKNDSLPNIACPILSLMLLGTEDMHFIPLTTVGCIGNLNLKIGPELIEGKNADLSFLGTNIFAWHELEFRRDKYKYEIYLDGKSVYTLVAEGEIGDLIGLNVNFSGSGRIDFVEVAITQKQQLIYREDF